MLVLKGIRKIKIGDIKPSYVDDLDINKDSLRNYLLNKDYCGIGRTNSAVLSFYDNLFFDILDTETNKLYSDITILDILDKLDKILGIIDRVDNIVFIKVTNKFWNFMDICGLIKEVNKSDLPINMTLPEKIDRYNYIEEDNSIKNFIVTYSSEPLDSLMLFWNYNRFHAYESLLNTYIRVFDITEYRIDRNSNLYLFCRNNKFYKLDINDNIIRYITKVRVIR